MPTKGFQIGDTIVTSICIGNYSSDKSIILHQNTKLFKKNSSSLTSLHLKINPQVYINSSISIKARYALKLDFPPLFCEFCFPSLEAF